MNIFNYIALFVIMVTMAAIPSASVALVITRTASLGLANGIAGTAGIVIGDLLLVLLALSGLSLLFTIPGNLFPAIKCLGGSYLAWLGFGLLRAGHGAGHGTGETAGQGEPASLLHDFLAGLLLTLADLKAVFFYLGLLPAFIDIGSSKPKDVAILALVVVTAVGGPKLIWAVTARKLALRRRLVKYSNGLKKTAGAILIGIGACLIATTAASGANFGTHTDSPTEETSWNPANSFSTRRTSNEWPAIAGPTF